MVTAPGATAPDLVAALARAGVHDVAAGDLDRALYAADASLYRVLPQVVVRPRHTDELEAVLAVARSTRTPLTMRGAGTSIAGNAVGPGIVVDTSRHLTRIRSFDPDAGLAVVEPGVVHAALQTQAVAAGWRFGPDPSTHTRCTVGGMVGNNACGSRALGYGRTSDNVEALDVLWGSGERQRLAPGVGDGVAGQLAAVAATDLGHVRTRFGQFSRQVSGYALEHLLPERLRPERFVVGSEGTLALVESATVRLVRDAPVRHLVVLGYGSMVEAADAVPGLLDVDGLVACEGLDERIVRLVSAPPDLPRGTGWLFAEVTGQDTGEAGERARAVVAAAGALEAEVVTDPAQQVLLWRIREDGAGLAARSLSRPAHSGWEDAAVPPERLGAWLREFDALLRAHDLDGVPYGHFGDGCVHVRIDFDFTDGGRRFREFLRECALALAAHGGSLSGEHGDGRARSELLPLMYDVRSLALFAAAKAVADPEGLLNPGVLVDPAPLDADLRPARPVRAVTGLRLVDDLAGEAHRCTGVGKCVSAHAPGVMCPSWQATRAEKDSTRGRARVLQEALDGDGTLTGLDDDAVAQALDLCLSCKACATDCPTGVDMATLKSEVLHQRYAGPLGWVRRPRTHHTLGRLPALLDSPARRLLPLAGGDGALARLAKRVAGVDPRRSLPTPARTTLRTGGVAPGDAARVAPDVWLWADTFTDHFAADAARAAVRFLEGAGLRAEVVGARGCCGLTYVSTGQLDAAARSVDGLVAALAPYVGTGAPVLGLEPSCLATVRSDALRLASDPESARQVAAATVTFAELLTRHDVALPDLTGTTVVVQPHCHQYAVGGFAPDEALLRRTGATVVTVAGCCGLAGNFGVEQGHHDVSVAVAETHLLPTLRAHPDAVVLADGMSCRTQVEDLAGRQVRTLAELLAGA